MDSTKTITMLNSLMDIYDQFMPNSARKEEDKEILKGLLESGYPSRAFRELAY